MYGVPPYKPIQIVTELCSGGHLFGLLHQQRSISISWAQKWKICTDTADAMEYLHSFDPPIIHRDLKSLNLLLASPVYSEDTPVVVKVSDFGLARLNIAAKVRSWYMTQQVGTLRWMAPEMMGHAMYDEKVDVYGYAMTMYEVVARTIPFQELADDGLSHAIQQGLRPDLATCPADCPVIFKSLMQLCWHQIPDSRPDFPHILKYLGMLELELDAISPKC
mmetsp:Transcript_122811/g.355018  ORF Transcript_122811/g.355018 Transcript_122811/m.355018 type:complete len:220 (-) Transcript_122811:136-795(-)